MKSRPIKKLTIKQQKAAWEALTPQGRRMALARDVIAHLYVDDIGDIQSDTGYLAANTLEGENLMDTSSGRVTPEACSLIRENCSLCARGALLISRIDMFNSIQWDSLRGDNGSGSTSQSNTTDALAGSFSQEQLNLIECSFERSARWASPSNSHCSKECLEARRVAERFCDNHTPKERLLMIMQNIVDHRGTFRPEVEYMTEEVTYYVDA